MQFVNTQLLSDMVDTANRHQSLMNHLQSSRPMLTADPHGPCPEPVAAKACMVGTLSGNSPNFLINKTHTLKCDSFCMEIPDYKRMKICF